MIPYNILIATLCTFVIILDRVDREYDMIKKGTTFYVFLISVVWGVAVYFWTTSAFHGVAATVIAMILAALTSFFIFFSRNPNEEEDEKSKNVIEIGRIGTVVAVNDDGSILGQFVGMEGMATVHPMDALVEGDVFVVEEVKDDRIMVKRKKK